jgi:hypothetical protein
MKFNTLYNNLINETIVQGDDNPTMAYMGDFKNVIPVNIIDGSGFLKRIESDINRGVQYVSAFVKRDRPEDTMATWYYTLKPKEGFEPALMVKPE